jgi:hypothetical protein
MRIARSVISYLSYPSTDDVVRQVQNTAYPVLRKHGPNLLPLGRLLLRAAMWHRAHVYPSAANPHAC